MQRHAFWFAGLAGIAVSACVLTAFAADRPKETSPAAESKPTDTEQLLETAGVLAAGQLYQTYLNIGLIADGKAEGVYSDKDVESILDSVLTLQETLDQRLTQIAKMKLNDEDRESIRQLRLLSALLRQQGDELKAFWKTGKKEHSDKYEATRKEAWMGISKLLKLEK